jgi:hypothetical protein
MTNPRSKGLFFISVDKLLFFNLIGPGNFPKRVLGREFRGSRRNMANMCFEWNVDRFRLLLIK